MTKIHGWTPIRLSGRLKFNKKKQPVLNPGDENKKPNGAAVSWGDTGTVSKRASRRNIFPGCTHQFHEYCQHTSLHGFRYVTEEKRTLSER